MKYSTKTILLILLFVAPLGFSMIPSVDAAWLTGWSDRQGITITSSAGAGTNYQISLNVTYETQMQSDFDDLRFTEDDGDTELDYWIEIWSPSAWAVVWVEITDNLNSTDSNIYMYSGNAGVSTTSSGWDTFLFFDDFENNNFDRWDYVDTPEWQIQSTTVYSGAYSAYVDSSTSTDALYVEPWGSPLTHGIMLHTWARFALATESEYPMLSYSQDLTVQYAVYSPNNEFSTYNGSSVLDYFTNGQTIGDWTRLEIGFDYENSDFVPYINRVHRTDQPLKDALGATITEVYRLYSGTSPSASADFYLDNYYCRKWVLSEPLVYWGIWNLIGFAELIFPVAWHPVALFGYNAFFVFLGLIMIPASTMYIVRGGRKEMSRDKLFYALIIFFMGLGLLIDGVMP